MPTAVRCTADVRRPHLPGWRRCPSGSATKIKAIKNLFLERRLFALLQPSKERCPPESGRVSVSAGCGGEEVLRGNRMHGGAHPKNKVPVCFLSVLPLHHRPLGSRQGSKAPGTCTAPPLPFRAEQQSPQPADERRAVSRPLPSFLVQAELISPKVVSAEVLLGVSRAPLREYWQSLTVMASG